MLMEDITAATLGSYNKMGQQVDTYMMAHRYRLGEG